MKIDPQITQACPGRIHKDFACIRVHLRLSVYHFSISCSCTVAAPQVDENLPAFFLAFLAPLREPLFLLIANDSPILQRDHSSGPCGNFWAVRHQDQRGQAFLV